MTRVSLRDRKARAIEAAAEEYDAAVQPEVEREPQPASTANQVEESTPVTPPAPCKAPAKARTAGTVRVGIYFHPDEFDRAKAAYLADWQHGGQADTFARWIAAAMDTHARRTPQERAELAKPRPTGQGSGGSRSFTLPADSVTRMRAAIAADQAENRWPTDSGWCGEAISAAADLAERKSGGKLPPAPPRLPNRLTR